MLIINQFLLNYSLAFILKYLQRIKKLIKLYINASVEISFVLQIKKKLLHK